MCEASLKRTAHSLRANSTSQVEKSVRGSSYRLAPCKTIGIRASSPTRRLQEKYSTASLTCSASCKRTTLSGSLDGSLNHRLCLGKQSTCLPTQRKTLGHLLREFLLYIGDKDREYLFKAK